MSGIAGAVFLDGRPAPPEDLRRMLRALAHRGPDGEGEWCQGPAAFGHRMLHTTPESLGEVMPLVSRDGRLVVTADARIDNREELRGDLDWATRAQALLPDSRLILGAYEKWGLRCTEHLVGDFAFAVWDRIERRLFCARDHMGVKPFYYHHRPGGLFAFASEIKGLLALREVPRRLNETRIADYLQSSFDDQEITFYDGIVRLPPGHRLLVTPARITVERYWSLDPEREVRFRSDAEYAERFREVFDEAVRCRLRSAFPVGSALSGGLDSSSIVCTARELLGPGAAALHTFSLVFNDLPGCDERPYIDAVLAGGGVVSHRIRTDHLSPMAELDSYLDQEDEASWVCNMSLHRAMHRAAAGAGVRVFLDGLSGDEVVCHGTARLPELLRTGRILELAVSVVRLGRHFHRSPLRILRRKAIRPMLPRAALRTWTRLKRTPVPAATAIRPLVARELAERTALAERLRHWQNERPRVPDSVRGSHYLGLLAGITGAGFESIDRVAAAFSLEPRYPFADRRLVEYCLALPSEQKLRWGWTRASLRRAMAGTLPEIVRRRGGKADLSPYFNERFLQFERDRIEAVCDDPTVIEPYVDIAALRDLYREYATGSGRQDPYLLWNPVMLALWLRHTGFAREGHDALAAATG